ncbi:MAG: hypothetical protein GEEBNDBF_02678 [bacterium]|nr:hypothetical protein [bacterium]
MEVATPPIDSVPYEGPLQFQFSALVQASTLSNEGPFAPAILWALTYVDAQNEEQFYLTNTDLLRQFPLFLDKLRALPEGASIGQEMFNQGLPCYFFVERRESLVRLNVAHYRDGRDRLLREDILLSWDEFVALITQAARRFLEELAGSYPKLRRYLNPPIESFNQWASRWQLIPFQPPPDMGEDLATASATQRGRRVAPLSQPIYLEEWLNHKAANQRLNALLVATYVGLILGLLLLPLPRLPLGLWLFPLVAVALPWLLVQRYPVLPLDSPLWLDHGIKWRVFFLDTITLLSGGVILLAASRHSAEVMWLWLYPLGWLICLFCGLGFPGTHLARPLWDWTRPMILGSLLLASLVMGLLADLGTEMAVKLSDDRFAPRVVQVQQQTQQAVSSWTSVPLKQMAQPVARFIDEYSAREQISQLLPYPHPSRAPLGGMLRWLWMVGMVAYALGLAWAQLPSPLQVRVHSTPVQ